MNMMLSQAERDRIARDYGAAVPSDLTVTRYPRGHSAMAVQYVWAGDAKGLVCKEDYRTARRRMLETSWKSSQRRNAAERLRRRQRVAELHAQGWLNWRMAQELCVSANTVSEDVRALGLTANQKPNLAVIAEEARAREIKTVVRRIRELVSEGLYATEIAERLARPVQSITGCARVYGIKLPRRPKRKHPRRNVNTGPACETRAASIKRRAAEAAAMRLGGATNAQIMRHFGVSGKTVSRWIKKYGDAE